MCNAPYIFLMTASAKMVETIQTNSNNTIQGTLSDLQCFYDAPSAPFSLFTVWCPFFSG